MPLSPRTRGMMQPPPTEEDARQAFEMGFSDMAHGVLASKFPELVEDIATFKIIKSDIQDGSAVGAFLLVRGGSNYIIPVVLAGNQIKPLDVVYAKDQNIFLPLKQTWLEELDRAAGPEMGEPTKAPENLPADVDIRNLVVPPAVGRYSYASEGQGTALVQFLSEAPNNVKLAFAKVLENKPRLLKYAFENFDRETLLDAMALHPETTKTAAMPSELVEIFTADNSAEQFREVFGNAAADAFQKAAQEGYAVKDKRIVTNVAVDTEEPGKAIEATESGFYRIQLSDGAFKEALVVAYPSSLEAPTKAGRRTDFAPQESEYKKYHRKRQENVRECGECEGYNYNQADRLSPDYMVYTEDGELYTMKDPPVGHMLHREELSGRLAELAQDENPDTLSGRGFFLCAGYGKIRATEPFEALSTSTGSDGTRRTQVSTGRVLVTHPDAPGKAVHAPEGSGVTYIPPSFNFVKVKQRNFTRQPIRSFDEHLRNQEVLAKHAAYAVKVRDTGAGLFSLNGSDQLTKHGALVALIKDVGLRKEAAESILQKTAEKKHHSFFVLRPMGFYDFVKEAQGMMGAPMPPQQGAPVPPQQGAPQAPPPGGGTPGEGMPPEGMGMAEIPMGMMSPGMGMPPAPPPPSPVDLAVVQLSSELAQQSSAIAEQLAEQQQQLATHLQVLEAVKERADMIAGTPGGMPPEAAMGGMPPEAAMGAAPGGMPMGASVPPEQIAAQSAPYMEQAADLNDPEAFESTAIGSLAATGELPDMVINYVPNLEEALDNLGRILLSLWMRESALKSSIGEMDYIDIEDKLRTVFENLGDLILRINQIAMTKAPNEEALA